MYHDPNWQQQVSAERDRYSDPACVESWTADRVIRDLGLSPDQAESALTALLGAGLLTQSRPGGGLVLTSRARDYIQHGAGRRRSVRIPDSGTRSPGQSSSVGTTGGAGRERDLNFEARERLHYNVLRWLRDQVGTDCRQIVSAVGLAHRLHTSTKEVYAAIEHLARHGLVGYHGAGPRVCITRAGLRQLDSAQRRRSVRIRRD